MMFASVHSRADHPLATSLQAVTEVVRAQLGGSTEPTSIHFFGALMSGLDSADSSDHWPNLLKLLVLLLVPPSSTQKAAPSLVPASVLRSRYTQAMQVFAGILQRGSSLGPAVLRPLILCIGSVLSAQDSNSEFWSIPANKRALMTLTELLVDERPKVRRAANDAIHRVLYQQRLLGGAGASRIVFEFCDQVISAAAMENTKETSKSFSQKNETLALQTISFLRLNSSHFTAKATKKLLLRISDLVLKRAAHTSARGCSTLATKAIHHFVCDTESPIHPNAMMEVLSRFLEPWSSKTDSSLVCAVVNLLADGISRISKMPSTDCDDSTRRDLAINFLPRVAVTLVGFFHSNSNNVHQTVADAFARVIVNCVDERLVHETNQAMHAPSSKQRIALPLENVVASLNSLLQPRHKHAWNSILPLLSGLFRHLASTSDPVTGPILSTISSLLDRDDGSDSSSTSNQVSQSVAPGPIRDLLEDVAGAAVEAMGAAAFMRHVSIGNPAASSSEEIDISMACLDRRLWVLPILKRHVRRTRSNLSCFHKTIYGLALLCEAVANNNEKVPSMNSETSSGQSRGEIIAVMMRSRSMQLWELFVSFCYRPIDIPTYFNTLAPLLGKAIMDQRYPVLQQNVCAGLSLRRKTMGTKQSRNASIKKIERIHEQKLRYNGHADGHAEDKSHNVKTRLALMPRPLSRSNKRNHKSKAMTIIRSRSSTPFNTNIEGEIWSNEIMPWDNNDNTGIVEHLQKQWHAEDAKGGVKSAMKTKVIDQRPMSAKQRESMARTEVDVATKTTFSAANSPRIVVPSSVRINISVLAILATIKMSFEVNGKLLTKSSNGWEEINIADELLLAMRATLDRDAKNIMGVSSSRNASFDWQNAHGQWEPLISGASMKDAVHDQFHNMPLENERPKDDKGLNLIIRIRPKNQQSLPDDESQLKSTSLSVHDGNVGNNLLQSRGKSRGSVGYSRSSSRQSSRQSISRGMSRDMLESLKSK